MDSGIIDLNMILSDYSNTYKSFQEEILRDIDMFSKNGLLGRKIVNNIGNIENCVFSFKKRNYLITFFALKDDEKLEIVVYNLTISSI